MPLVGKDQYTGGVSWTKPIADISEYLVDGENTITIDYHSVLSNLQLDRGVIRELRPYLSYLDAGWWRNDQIYLEFGPRQAKIVPFVEVSYDASLLDVSASVTPRTLAGKVYLSVSATNDDTVPVDVVISTEFGNKTFTDVAPGKTVSVSINSRLGSVPAGEATVKVNGDSVTETKTVPYAALPAS